VEIYPDSLVLTEDDHLDFMATLLSNKDIVPLRVREVLSNHSLILLGYGPRNWDFRVIFRAMLRSDTSHLRPKSVSIQLPLGNAHEKAYVENYLAQEAKFEVFWGDTEDVVKQLWERTQAKYPAILYQ
jgi:hypothetical protein